MPDPITTLASSAIGVVIGGLVTYYFTPHSKLYELSEKIGKTSEAIQHLKEKLEDAAFGLTSMLKLLLDKELVTGEDVINTFGIEYLTRYKGKLSNPNPSREERLKELIDKARTGRITRDEALELQKLLEEQKKKHEKEGDIEGLILVLALLLALGYILKKLSE